MKLTSSTVCALVPAIVAAACANDLSGPERTDLPELFAGRLVDTLLLAEGDNTEAVQVIPGAPVVLALSAQAGKLSRLRVNDERLVSERARLLFDQGPAESELTHLAVNATGEWAAISRTLVTKELDGATVACHGEVVFVDVRDAETFGAVLSRVEVGPMPDAVAISGDGRWVAVANERDVVWGKCEGVLGLEPPSVSILSLADGPPAAIEVARLLLQPDEREPESLVFGRDDDLLAVTLQDSHELALLRLSTLLALSHPTTADITLTRLPANATGADPWPDGVTRFDGKDGNEYFAVAAEASDELLLLDSAGALVAQVPLRAGAVPADWPRLDGSWGTMFELDSLAAFTWHGRAQVVGSLKGSGAIAVWQVANPLTPTLAQVIKVGRDEMAPAGPSEAGSSVRSEGVAVSREFGFIVTANEGEPSVSLVLTEE